MDVSGSQPNWDEIAEKFDLWLPQLEPVGVAMLNALVAKSGDRILDIACGTGEPSMSLVKRLNSNVEVVGIDKAKAMVGVAQNKAVQAGYTKDVLRFTRMDAEQLDFEEKSFNKVMSRFGVMLLDDPMKGIHEMFRVIKMGGRLVFTVWSTPETMPTMKWLFDAFQGKVPDDALPPLMKATSLSEKAVVEQMLKDAGFHNVSVMGKQLDYRFASFDEYWDVLENSGIAQPQFSALNEQQILQIRRDLEMIAEQYMTAEGLIIPHEYVLASGVK